MGLLCEVVSTGFSYVNEYEFVLNLDRLSHSFFAYSIHLNH